MNTPDTIQELVSAFYALPGVGPNTAQRFAYSMLSKESAHAARNLAAALLDALANVKPCAICFNISDTDPCPICADATRDHSTICVVESPLDLVAIERTREYHGTYHVLHGAISPVEGVGPEDLRIKELLDRLASGKVDEVILATNPNLEGETTAMYLERALKVFDVRVTRLARGLPIGGDLEYADAVTLTRALEGRQEV